MMKNNQKIYKDLKKKYSKKELAENFYVSKQMTPKEKKQSNKEIWNLRKESLEELSPEDKIYSGLLRLKYQIKNYTDKSFYDESKSVATYLREYMSILNKKQKAKEKKKTGHERQRQYIPEYYSHKHTKSE